MRWMIVSVLAFGASSAAAAGYVAMQSSKEATPAESDSALAVAEVPASEEQPAGAIDSVAVKPDTGEVQSSSDVTAVDSTDSSLDGGCPAVELASAVQPVAPPEPSLPDPEAQKQAYRQVARILSNMGDAEVAQLLAHVEDEEIEVILRNVTAREGARILSQLSGERAAELSRRLLVAATDSGGSNR